jgi:dienelactone hydrolase
MASRGHIGGALALLVIGAIGCGDSADAEPSDAGGDGDAGVDAAEPDGVTPSGPAPSVLPEVQGECPELVSGNVEFGNFHATMHVPAAAAVAGKHGPMVFYWHGTGSNPGEALIGLGADVIAEILAEGGVVAAMDGGQGTGFVTGPFEWRADDFDFADQVLACAIDQFQIDTRRIHAVGMSAGGLQTSNMAYWRANYMASVVVYSGGGAGLRAANDYPDNKFPALMFHGGPTDSVANLNFQMSTEKMIADLTTHAHFAVMCDHGMGHTIPTGAGIAAWRFFRDHPYMTSPAPYVAAGLPDALPDYCETQ